MKRSSAIGTTTQWWSTPTNRSCTSILRKPEILILDESTSQIDMASEIQIRETLEAMKGKMTIIIITHREALLKFADEVYTIDKGVLSKSHVDYSTSGSIAA